MSTGPGHLSSPVVGTLPTQGAPTGEARGFRILVAYSPEPDLIGLPRVLGATPLVVGREADGLNLPDGTASRAHAAFDLREGVAFVRDLGSRNGVFVGGARRTEAALAHGDVVRIGDHLLVVQAMDAADIARLLAPPAPSARLLGDGIAMRALRERIAGAARGKAAVLVLGESGSGKELVAAELHDASRRAGAFVPVNCAAIPEQLAESELFGHAKGAFTGALALSDGLFGAADGGTIFLDEIGETSPATQARLLRVLESGEVRRVGETSARVRDVRVVAATNVDLARAVDEGRFRGDLYARLSAHVVEVAPLRARREDLLGLAVAYADAPEGRRPTTLASAARVAATLSPDAAEALLCHAFRWNVRELVQLVRAVAAAPRPLKLAALPAELRAPFATRAAGAETAAASPPRVLEVRPDAVPTEAELRTVIAHFAGNVSRIAAFFGKERRQIYRWAERFGLDLGAAREE